MVIRGLGFEAEQLLLHASLFSLLLNFLSRCIIYADKRNPAAICNFFFFLAFVLLVICANSNVE